MIHVKRLLLGAVVTLGLALNALPALAAPSSTVNPGQRLGQWIMNNVAALFAPILAVVALYYLAKRQFTQFISFAIFAVVVSLFVFAGDVFRDSAVDLAKWLIGK